MYIADFHIHSKYSRATSKDCVPEVLDLWARRKGIHVLGTGDFTHPAWREELKEKLVPSEEGLYVLKDDFRQGAQVAGTDFKPRFIISGEISSIYKKNGRVRKVHNLILLPGLEHAELISRRLEAIGNLRSDGRPILGLDSRDLLEIVLDICPEAIFIPAHIWTPHFSLFGAYSGFDDIHECFEDLTGYIYALETGLSSDPPMNWRLSALDGFTLVSNSDAHSPANLGREVNLFDTELSYPGILKALKNRGTKEFYGTIEFFPEEGKYHYDGHRACKVCWKPGDTKAAGGICPVCGGRITVGVLHRVEVLADREEGFVPAGAKHFESLVPLHEVIASSIGAAAAGTKVRKKYDDLIRTLGSEFFILREASLKDIELAAGPCITEGIRRLRAGKVGIQPGFDGEYGKIQIIDKSEIGLLSGQMCFMGDQLFDHKIADIKGQSFASPLESLKAAADEAAPALASMDTRPAGEDTSPEASASDDTHYGLNPEQWEAVSANNPAIAVIAGPGTGKTKTLVSRIIYLVEKCGVPPRHITAVTFTNKAAKEMQSRLQGHFKDKGTVSAMTIGTFHSICLQILSQWKGKHGVTVIDEYQAISILEGILKDMKLEISARKALSVISLLKNGGVPSSDDREPDISNAVYDSYCTQLKHFGVMDYDDILLEALQGFEDTKGEEGPDRDMAQAFSYLLVDEFQDINEIQYRLIKAWSRKSENVFIIGDPDQSIYGFRGSDSRYFEKFTQDFPGMRQIRLTRNYRSTPEIINSALSVISKSSAGGEPRSLEAKREQGSKVRLIESNHEFSEALFISREINRLVGGIDMLDTQNLSASRKKRNAAKQAVGFSDIAVLYRTNRQAEMLEQCFLKEGIPYTVAGRDDFLSDKPVREALAFFRFLLNPADMASLLLSLKAESGHTAEVNQALLKHYAAGEKKVSALMKAMERLPLPLQKLDGQSDFIELLKKYQPIIHREKPWKLIEAWMQDKNLAGVESMERLLNTAVVHHKMASFIQNLVLGRETDIVRSGSRVYNPEAVSLMTMHGAKGLEFPVVFIYGVNDGRIPLRNGAFDIDMDEERRLFYVGMTRARDELILLTSSTPSPFIADISEETLVKEQAFPQKQESQFKQISFFA